MIVDASVRVPGPPSAADFRDAMGRFATGVAVATTVADGVDHAMTLNAFTSVSLDPLLALICVEKIARFHDAVLASGRWAVSVLAVDGAEASRRFATRGRRISGQLDGWACRRGPATGAAILTGALAAVECRTWKVQPAGDHTVVIGEVAATEVSGTADRPLLYYRGRYGELCGPGDVRG